MRVVLARRCSSRRGSIETVEPHLPEFLEPRLDRRGRDVDSLATADIQHAVAEFEIQLLVGMLLGLHGPSAFCDAVHRLDELISRSVGIDFGPISGRVGVGHRELPELIGSVAFMGSSGHIIGYPASRRSAERIS